MRDVARRMAAALVASGLDALGALGLVASGSGALGLVASGLGALGLVAVHGRVPGFHSTAWFTPTDACRCATRSFQWFCGKRIGSSASCTCTTTVRWCVLNQLPAPVP